MMKRWILALATTVLLAPVGAVQAQVSYTHLHAAGIDSEADTALGELDGTGGEFGISLDVIRRMHVFASYKLVDLDDFDFETETIEAGVGFNAQLNDRQSVFVNVSYLEREFDVAASLGSLSGDEDGYGVSVGYRETNNRRLEFLVRLDHVDFEDSNYSDTSMFTSLQIGITRRFRIEAGINFGGDDTYGKLGVRYYLPTWVQRDE